MTESTVDKEESDLNEESVLVEVHPRLESTCAPSPPHLSALTHRSASKTLALIETCKEANLITLFAFGGRERMSLASSYLRDSPCATEARIGD